MFSIDQRDLFYETAKSLTFNDLRHLCQSNRENRSLCNDERVQQLIQQRYRENRINHIINKLNEYSNDIRYIIVFVIENDHTLSIETSYTRVYQIKEASKGDYTRFVLYQYMKNLANVEKLGSPQDLTTIANKIISHHDNIPGPIQTFYPTALFDEIVLAYPKNREIREVLEIMYTIYPQTKIISEQSW